MTRKERLQAVIDGNITEELINDCKKELEKISQKNIKRKTEDTKRNIENRKIMENITEILKNSSNPLHIEEIMQLLPIKNITRQKISALCAVLRSENKIQSKDINVKNKGKRKVYFIENCIDS